MGGTTTHFNVSRRTFLRAGALGIAGAFGGAPASWAARELSLLTAVNYAPASDAKLDELGKRFAKLAGVTVRIDHVQSVQMPAKLSAELMSRSGHDVMSLEMHYPWLFQPGLADVSELCQNLARQHGEWYPFLREHALVKGQSSRRWARRRPTPGKTCCGPGASSRSSAIPSASPSARRPTR